MRIKINNKGQIMLPEKIRNIFHLKINDEVNVFTDDSSIHLYPIIEESVNLKEEYKKYGFPNETDIDEATRKGLIF